MTTEAWIHVAAIALGPVTAIVVSRWMQLRKEKHDAKLKTFLTLLANRHTITARESVDALNTLSAVFADNRKVLQHWHSFYDAVNHPTDRINWQSVAHIHLRLLSEMAKDLHYPEIDQVDLDRCYSPQGPAIQADMAGRLQQELLRVLENSATIVTTPRNPPSLPADETKKHEDANTPQLPPGKFRPPTNM